MQANRNHSVRYLAIVLVFCVICVIYLGRLFYIQIAGRENTYDTGTTTRQVTVQAVRGEIYDRNGKKLVSNSYTYDLKLSYNRFSALRVQEKNEVCLQLAQALRACDAEDSHTERFFPFEGSYYPYYYYNEETTDGDSLRYYRLGRVLSDLGLDADTSAEELRDHYVEVYQLLATDADGNRLYDDDEIDTLIHLYYDMDALRFRSTGEYSFATDADMTLMTYVKERNLSAVDFMINIERVYSYPGYASHILGTVGPIYSEEWEYYNEQGYQMNAIVGKTGCESAFEEYLRGTDGILLIEEDSAGNIVNVTVKKEPVAGCDVYLTVDMDLQIAAEDGLAENVAYVSDRATSVATGSECRAGATVVMDPDTFEVLAIASYPTYDLSTYNANYDVLAGNEDQPLLNRALNGYYAPGSTFKLGMAAVGLMEEAVTANTVISCVGKYPSAGFVGGVGCSTYGDNHWGGVDVVHAIAYSCNSFFCELGTRLGIETMERYMSRFGFGESTGFELGGTSGVLAGPTYRGEIHGDAWTTGNTWHASIGQSDTQASPLQLACYVSTLVNGGTRYTAHLLHSVYKVGNSEPIYLFAQTEDTVLDSIEIPTAVLDTVFEGMREVVANSSVIRRWINSSIPVTVGGKTGTAQTGTECDNALFVCAAPYDDPEIVIATVLEQGYTGGYAALTAGRVLEKYYSESGE